MDRYSFLNAVHPAQIAALYDKYLQYPDSVEPSWRAFFQGFDFGLESDSLEAIGIAPGEALPESVRKEFQVIQLIDGYRSRGHLFTKTNPVRERRKYVPTLAIENFGLSEDDLSTVAGGGHTKWTHCWVFDRGPTNVKANGCPQNHKHCI